MQPTLCLCALCLIAFTLSTITLLTSHSVQNFLFTTRDEDAPMKVIDFGLSDFIRTGNGYVNE